MKPIHIAVILTCFNRREKTKACLTSLFEASKHYSAQHGVALQLVVYLTDDGCTDGTSEAIQALCNAQHVELHIVKGNGQWYWARGMRMSWLKALQEKERWQFYLLLNDDTLIYSQAFDELFGAHQYALTEMGHAGIYAGITCMPDNPNVITYGGDVFATPAQGMSHRMAPSAHPQQVHVANANILLIPTTVVAQIGIFLDCYVHSCADFDYCMRANRQGIPTLLTARVCGECANDHESQEAECLRLINMSLRERKAYVCHPLHADAEYLTFVKRNMPRKYPISWLMRKMRLYTPQLYYYINKLRGLYKETAQPNTTI